MKKEKKKFNKYLCFSELNSFFIHFPELAQRLALTTIGCKKSLLFIIL
jgi:hypothetical protein